MGVTELGRFGLLWDTLGDFIRTARTLQLRPGDALYDDLFLLTVKRIGRNYLFVRLIQPNAGFCRAFAPVADGDLLCRVDPDAFEEGSGQGVTLYDLVVRHYLALNPLREIAHRLLKRYAIVRIGDSLQRYLDGIRMTEFLGEDEVTGFKFSHDTYPFLVRRTVTSVLINDYVTHRLREFDPLIQGNFLGVTCAPYVLGIRYSIPIDGSFLNAVLRRSIGEVRVFERRLEVEIVMGLSALPLSFVASPSVSVESYRVNRDLLAEFDFDTRWIGGPDHPNYVYVEEAVPNETNVAQVVVRSYVDPDSLYDFVFNERVGVYSYGTVAGDHR